MTKRASYLTLHGYWKPVPAGGVYESACAECGMGVWLAEYHPWSACELFKERRNGEEVRANIEAIVEFGAKHAEAGR